MDPEKGRPAGIPLRAGAAVARLRSAQGAVVGAGFLVGDRRLVTCAHVVQSALGRSDAMRPGDEEFVNVDFPLAAPGTARRARGEAWPPAQPDDSGDVAVLSILDPMPVPI